MKKLRLADARDLLLKSDAWSIHEPALASLLELLAGQSALSVKQINERLGLARLRIGDCGLRMEGHGNPQSAIRNPKSEDGAAVQMVGAIAVLPVFGLLMQRPSWLTRALGWTTYEALEKDFRAALANDQVQGIVLYCDSPGGVALGVEEVSQLIFAGRGVKPIQAFVRGLCASACYYLASGAAQITASPSSTVGSIGTIYTHVEYAAALKDMGIGVTVIKHGARKGDGNPYEKLSPEAKASLQHWVDAYGEQFDAAVARNRGITVADVRARFGQGQAFLAAEARERGLVDAVGTWEQVVAALGFTLPVPGSKLQVASCQLPVGAGKPATWNLQPGTCNLERAVPHLVGTAHPTATASGSPTAADEHARGRKPTLPLTTHDSPSPERSSMKISARVRAALFARGLIAAQDCDDAVALAALNAYFAARGEACPVLAGQGADGKLDDEKIVAALFSAHPQSAIQHPQSAAAGGASSGAPAGNVQQAHEREMLEARQQAAAGERERQKKIRASGQLLGLSAEQITAAIDSGQSHAEVVEAWHGELAAKEKPVSGASVQVGPEGIERYVQDASLAVQLHYGLEIPAAAATPEVRQLASAPILAHAERCLQAAGIRYDPYDREGIAEAALGMDGSGRSVIRAEGGGAFNRPGSFPNLLSALANKMFDAGAEQADVTYPVWTGLWPGDLPDFKPAPIVSKGIYGELDEVLDAEEFKEQGLAEEMLSYMQLARYGNSVKLTPVLVANDDLGVFVEDMVGLAEGWELTVNRGCLRLVTGNVALLDGFALYDDTNHKNHIASGGNPPGTTEWNAMQVKMAKQTTIGGKAYARARLSIALVPPALEVAALQTFAPLRDINEQKQAAVDSNLNVFRGRVTVAVEPELTAASEVEWYGFCDPRRFANATIIRAYFRGWGRRGRRERWYDPATKCWHVSLEGRAGFAAKQYRTTIKTKGAA